MWMVLYTCDVTTLIGTCTFGFKRDNPGTPAPRHKRAPLLQTSPCLRGEQ
jgi:hypothetical protein